MTPADFVAKWKPATLKERSAAQEHFTDLCRMLGEPTPAEADPTGDWFCFERGASKAGGGDGWADVWRRGCFGWEYKGKGKNLKQAFKQLQLYAPALENPPLLIVSDIDTITIHTNFTSMVPERHVLTLDDLLDAGQRKLLKWAFTDPEQLRPDKPVAALTEEAAGRLARLATELCDRGHDPRPVAHFLNRVLFCLFAEDVGLLPGELFSKLLEAARPAPADLPDMLRDLFGAMQHGGRLGFERIDRFNGGLFDSDDVLPLEPAEIKTLLGLAKLDWSAIEPSIFGTLFVRGLDPDMRSQLGAHYTDTDSIMRIVNPVIVEPLRDAWAQTKARISADLAKAAQAKDASGATRARNAAEKHLQAYLARLAGFRVLDPACGSGNFLYLALRALKDLEHEVILQAEAMGLPRAFPMVGPEAVLGIEINPYAAELARVTIWIGEIQWMLQHGFDLDRSPILKPLQNIENRDAVLGTDADGHPVEPEWPEADAIVGNPPFLGDKRMRSVLGKDYVSRLRALYKSRVPGGADLVTYWFEKARAQIEAGRAKLAGLVATNSIRQQRNRPVLGRILETGTIFNAWADEPWINEGAAVRVSMIGFSAADIRPVILNGEPVVGIYADLSGAQDANKETDITQARTLVENEGYSYFGLCLAGAFAVDSETARHWLKQPNPNGKPNADVLRPIWNGSDITKRWKGRWVIDFGPTMTEADAALYEAPFAHVVEHVKPKRITNNRRARAVYWWRHGEARPGLRRALYGLARFIATSETARHRIFIWLSTSVAPEHKLVVFPREDDHTFGLLSARTHVVWATAKGGRLGVGNDPTYSAGTCFETFPFPEGLTPDLAPADYSNPHAEAIAQAARTLNEHRENWLNPRELTKRVPEVVEGYPDRILPVDAAAEKALKKRTLTNLYNERPTWLDNDHKALDTAVATAYGWDDYSPDMPDDEILSRLLALNLERAERQA